MKIAILNPPLLWKKRDYMGSGIPFVPISLAYLSSYLKSKKFEVQVIDGFGESPKTKRVYRNNLLLNGLSFDEIISRISKDVEAICIYANLVVNHSFVLELVKRAKEQFKAPVIVFENSLAVTAYSLRHVYKDFFNAGADFVVSGEPEERVYDILKGKDLSKIDGIIYRNGTEIKINEKTKFIENLDALPFPAYDMLPMEGYWSLRYAHGPSSKKYMPIMTSRGCPYGCRFCVVPETNKRKWRARSAKNVVDEIEHFYKTMGIREFHIEDLNPTILKERMVEISKDILSRDLKITMKISAGTKVESLDEETVEWMAKAGLEYLSISPESGSKRLMKLINKPFDYELGLRIIKKCYELGVSTQACFVLGFPGETDDDRKLTKDYIVRLARAGVDEITLFIIAPLPGAYIYESFERQPLETLSFSPHLRKGFRELSKWRLKLYTLFMLNRAVYHPQKIAKSIFNIASMNFHTKMEMAVYKAIKTI